MSLFNLRNPIPREPDPDKAWVQWMARYRVVPQYGDSAGAAFGFSELVRDLCELSPTYGTVMRIRRELTFGHRLRVCGRNVAGLAGERTEVDYEVQLQWVEMLAGLGLTLTDIIAMSGKMDEHLTQSGNAYLMISRARVGGEVAYFFEVLHYLHCIYTASDDAGEHFLLHSTRMGDAAALGKYPPKLLRVTRKLGRPLRWMQDAGDPATERTVIHLRNTEAVDDGKLYGRSPLIRNLTHLYIDFQTGNHISKVAATAILVRKLIAIMKPDPNILREEVDERGEKVNQFAVAAKLIKELVTVVSTPGNELGPKPGQGEVAVVGYPYGGVPPEVIDFEVNHDTKYLQFQEGYAARHVAAALSLDITLTSLAQAQTGLGGNLLYDTYVQNNRQSIAPRQDHYENLWNGTLAQIMEEERVAGPMQVLGVEFPDAVGQLLADLRPTTPAQAINQQAAPETPEDEDDESQ